MEINENLICDKTVINVNEVRNFVNASSAKTFSKALVDAIFEFLPFLSTYREEGNEFSFKIVLGKQEGENEGLAWRHSEIRIVDKPSDEMAEFGVSNPNEEVLRKKYVSALKDVVIFCRRGCDVYIIEGDKSVEFGIYYTDIEKTGVTEKYLLEAGFYIFEPQTKTKISIRYENVIKFVYFDLDETNPKNLEDSQKIIGINSAAISLWNGIFARVKKEVHGTICLVVKPDWTPEWEETNGTFLQLHPVNNIQINIAPKGTDALNELNANILTLLSMLDYDGVTIIDTDSRIRAFHNFCSKISNSTALSGGARHNAFDYLKNQKNDMFRAVYLQSQEGEIEFYDYETKETLRYFDSSIMDKPTKSPGNDIPFGPAPVKPEPENGPGSSALSYAMSVENDKGKFIQVSDQGTNILIVDSDQKETEGNQIIDHIVKFKVAEPQNNSNEQTINLGELEHLIEDLRTAHFGFNNFFNEVEPARRICNMLKNELNVKLLNSNQYLAVKLMDVCVNCYVGNSYGYSRNAISFIWEIIDKISNEKIVEYFTTKFNEDSNLTWIMSRPAGYTRYKELVLNLQERKGLGGLPEFQRSAEEFGAMYIASLYILDEEDI